MFMEIGYNIGLFVKLSWVPMLNTFKIILFLIVQLLPPPRLPSHTSTYHSS